MEEYNSEEKKVSLKDMSIADLYYYDRVVRLVMEYHENQIKKYDGSFNAEDREVMKIYQNLSNAYLKIINEMDKRILSLE